MGFFHFEFWINPFSNPPIIRRFIMISNEQLNDILFSLKNDGISYKYVANISDISYDTFYFYRRCKNFPLDIRIRIEEALREKFGEYIDEYCK